MSMRGRPGFSCTNICTLRIEFYNLYLMIQNVKRFFTLSSFNHVWYFCEFLRWNRNNCSSSNCYNERKIFFSWLKINIVIFIKDSFINWIKEFSSSQIFLNVHDAEWKMLLQLLTKAIIDCTGYPFFFLKMTTSNQAIKSIVSG